MRSLAMVGIVCLFAACSESYDRPLDPVWGKQPCAHCAMLVTEARYSAQLTTQDPERIWFDDIGCLIAYIADRKPKVAHLWVHDAVTPRWLDATATRYQDGAKTPMDFGLSQAPRTAWTSRRCSARCWHAWLQIRKSVV